MDYEAAFEETRAMDWSAPERAERERRAGRPAEAVRIARAAIGHGDDSAACVALSLALLDQGELDEARHVLEMLLESLTGEGAGSGLHGAAAFVSHPVPAGMISDTTLAAATAATLDLVDALDDAGLERAIEHAEAQRELMLDADGVAEQVLREIPPEIPDEILPSADSPFATRTFADLLQSQGHEAEAETLRTALDAPLHAPSTATQEPSAQAAADASRQLGTLERWLDNLRRTAA